MNVLNIFYNIIIEKYSGANKYHILKILNSKGLFIIIIFDDISIFVTIKTPI